jgi:hypothetical protein
MDNKKLAVKKYRENHPEKYNEFQRNYYHSKKEDPEWKAKFNERCRLANKKYREKKMEGEERKQRGRPRKVIEEKTPIETLGE